jgi:fructan beta-fructosidase
MGDPSGLVQIEGQWHLFYWGHALSRDLLHWEHLPRALEGGNGVDVWSGSVVFDRGNTSGLGKVNRPPMVAIYTGRHVADGRQTQDLAFSTDDGRTWTKYAGNPVIDIGSTEFRDPQVFWYERERRWIMVVALSAETRVRFYASPDLKSWAYLSDFGPAGATSGVWECPDIFALPIDGDVTHLKWVLKVDVGPTGGQYFLGDFDGNMFHVDKSWLYADENLKVPSNGTLSTGKTALPRVPAHWIDYGDDFYASRSWHTTPESNRRRIWIGWMSNWKYAREVPTTPWKGMQSIPRELTLHRDRSGQIYLAQQPIRVMARLRRQHWHIPVTSISSDELNLSRRGIRGTTLEIEAEFVIGDAAEFGLRLRRSETEETVVGYEAASHLVFVDRTRSGRGDFNEDFPSRHEGPLQPEGGRVRLHIFVDRSSIEVFGNDGRTVLSDQIFPDTSSDGISVYARSGSARLSSLDVWQLDSIWAHKALADR